MTTLFLSRFLALGDCSKILAQIYESEAEGDGRGRAQRDQMEVYYILSTLGIRTTKLVREDKKMPRNVQNQKLQ
jgi:hypothetical protein